jgi:hypothetical protein
VRLDFDPATISLDRVREIMEEEEYPVTEVAEVAQA